MAAKTKEVILKCRFGDHLPDPRVAVELDASSADYLISQGLAELPKADTVVQGDKLPVDVKALRDEVKGLKAQVEALTTERDNALTELALAKGASNGTDSTPSK